MPDFETMVTNGDVKKVVLVQNRTFVEVTLKQEALNNVPTHASCTPVLISLYSESGTSGMIIADNGLGFDPNPDYLRRHAIEVDRQVRVHRRQHGGIHAAIDGICKHRHFSSSAFGRLVRGIVPGQSTA